MRKKSLKMAAFAVAGCLLTLSTNVNVFADTTASEEESDTEWTEEELKKLWEQGHQEASNMDWDVNGESVQAEINQALLEKNGFSDTCYYDIPGTWVQEADGRWWYHHKAGGYTTNAWEQIRGKWYYFDAEGYMCTGWQDVGGRWFYLGEAGDGSMKTGWQMVNGLWYYLNSSGVMQYSWQKINNTWYYLDENGAMQTGWIRRQGKWYYLGETGDGSMKTGWQMVGDKWYYLDDSGAMTVGWLKDGNSWYYLKEAAAWRPFAQFGSMACNEDIEIDGVVYSFDASGKWIEK